MKNIFTGILMLILFNFLSINLLSQSKPDNTAILEEANNLYKSGEVDKIPALLNPYIEKGFSRKEKKQAYKLIVLSYLFEDLKQEASQVLIEFLGKFPEYTPDEDDPNDLKYLFKYKGFENNLVFSIGPLGGYSFTKPIIGKVYDGGYQINTETQTYGSLLYGLKMNLRVYKFIDIRLDALYGQEKFGFKQTATLNGNPVITEYTETLSLISAPLWISPYYAFNDHRLYLKIGGGINYLLSSNAELSREQINNSYDVSENRNTLTPFAGLGGGFSLKVPRGFISIEGNYLMGLKNIVNVDNRTNQNIEQNFYYIDDDYKLNNYMFSISYNYLFYKTKPVKQ